MKARCRSSSKNFGSVVSAPIFRFSSTVMRGKMRRPSGDWAMPSCMIWSVGMRLMSRPENTIEPSRIRGEPQIDISSVDLPAPLAPIRVTISPVLMVMSTARRASICP